MTDGEIEPIMKEDTIVRSIMGEGHQESFEVPYLREVRHGGRKHFGAPIETGMI
jgi:hypothetical protein